MKNERENETEGKIRKKTKGKNEGKGNKGEKERRKISDMAEKIRETKEKKREI